MARYHTGRGPLRERKYDLILNSVGYRVAGSKEGKPLWRVDAIAAELGDVPPPRGDVKERFETWHYGAGYGHSLTPGCYSYSTGMNASQPGVITMGPLVTSTAFGATVVGFFETNSTLYGLGGQYCKKINTTTDVISTVDTTGAAAGRDFAAGATVTGASVEYAGNIYVCFSSDTAIQKFSSGTTWTNLDPDTASATAVRAKYLAKEYLDGYNWRLFTAYSTAYVKISESGTDPMQADNWTTNPIEIGDTGQAIQGMTANDGIVWVAKADGLYPMDYSTRAPNVLKSVEKFTSTDNGVSLIADGSLVYFPHVMGLLGFNRQSGEILSLQPFARTGNTSSIYGSVTAQVRLGSWHYAAVYNGTDSYICQGRFPSEGEGMPPGWIGPMIWHPIAKVSSAKVQGMHITTLTSPARLYFGSGTDVSYIRIAKTGDQLAESNLTYATSGSIFFSPTVFGAPGTPKELVAFDIENEGFTSTNYVDLYLSLDGGAYTQWGSSATTAGRTRLTLPSGTWNANRTYIELRATQGVSTSTIKIKPVVARAALRPTVQDRYITTIIANDDIDDRDGSTDRKSGKTIVTNLNTLRNAAPKTLVDYWTGEARSQTVLVEDVRETIVLQEGNEPAAYGVELTMRVVP